MPRLCLSVLNYGYRALERNGLLSPCFHACGDCGCALFLIPYTLINYAIRKGKLYQYVADDKHTHGIQAGNIKIHIINQR